MSGSNPIPIEFIDLICFAHIECKCFAPFEGEFFEGDYESLFTFLEIYFSENVALYQELSQLDVDLRDCEVLSFYILLPENRPAREGPFRTRQEVGMNKGQFFLTSNEMNRSGEKMKQEESQETLHRINHYPEPSKETIKNIRFSAHAQEEQPPQQLRVADQTKSSQDMNDEKMAILLSSSRKGLVEEEEKMMAEPEAQQQLGSSILSKNGSAYNKIQVSGMVAYRSPTASERGNTEREYSEDNLHYDYDRRQTREKDLQAGVLETYLEGGLIQGNDDGASPRQFQERNEDNEIFQSRDEYKKQSVEVQGQAGDERNNERQEYDQQEFAQNSSGQQADEESFIPNLRKSESPKANEMAEVHNNSEGYFDEDTHLGAPLYMRGHSRKSEELSIEKGEFLNEVGGGQDSYEKKNEEEREDTVAREVNLKPVSLLKRRRQQEEKEKEEVEENSGKNSEKGGQNSLNLNESESQLSANKVQQQLAESSGDYQQEEEENSRGDGKKSEPESESFEKNKGIDMREADNLYERMIIENSQEGEDSTKNEKNYLNNYEDDFEDTLEEKKLDQALASNNKKESKQLREDFKEQAAEPTRELNSRSPEYEDDFEISGETYEKEGERGGGAAREGARDSYEGKKGSEEAEGEEEELELDGETSGEKKRPSEISKVLQENSSLVSEEGVKSLNESVAIFNAGSSNNDSLVSFGMKSIDKLVSEKAPSQLGKSPRFEKKFSPLAKYYIENGKLGNDQNGRLKSRPLSTIGNFAKGTGVLGKGVKNGLASPPWKAPGANASLFEKQTAVQNCQLPQIVRGCTDKHRRNKSANEESLTRAEKIEKQMIRALHLNKATLDRGTLAEQINQRQPSANSDKGGKLKVEKMLTQYIKNKVERDKQKETQGKKKVENEIVADLRRKRIEKMMKKEKEKNRSESPTSFCRKIGCQSHSKITDAEGSKQNSPEKKLALKNYTKRKDFINGILNKSEVINGHEKALIWYKSYLGKNL